MLVSCGLKPASVPKWRGIEHIIIASLFVGTWQELVACDCEDL